MFNLLLLVLMIAALGGMMLCGRLRRKRPALQVIAVLLLLLVLVSGAIFMNRTGTLQMLGFTGPVNEELDSAQKLLRARAYMLAKHIATVYPECKKILLIGPPGSHEKASSLLFELSLHGIQDVAVEEIAPATVTPLESDNLITDAADRAAEGSAVDRAIARHSDAEVIVLMNLSQNGDSIRRLKVYRQPDGQRPKIIVLGMNSINEWVADQLRRGIFSAIVVTDLTKTADAISRPVPDNPVNAFDSRYVLITRDSLQRHRRFFH